MRLNNFLRDDVLHAAADVVELGADGAVKLLVSADYLHAAHDGRVCFFRDDYLFPVKGGELVRKLAALRCGDRSCGDDRDIENAVLIVPSPAEIRSYCGEIAYPALIGCKTEKIERCFGDLSAEDIVDQIFLFLCGDCGGRENAVKFLVVFKNIRESAEFILKVPRAACFGGYLLESLGVDLFHASRH